MNSPSDANENLYFNEIQIDDGKWTREQTQILVDTWKCNKNILLNTASSLSEHFKVWKIIAGEVNKIPPPKTLQQCKKKFRNIRYICKTAINNNKQPGAKKHYPMFYSDFVKILSESQRVKLGERFKFSNYTEDSFVYRMDQCSPQNDPLLVAGNSDYEHSETTPKKSLCHSNKVSTFNSSNNSAQNSPCTTAGEETFTNDTLTSSLPSTIVGMVNEVPPNDDTVRIAKVEETLDRRETEAHCSIDSNETLLRKHKHVDISIMGHSYAPPKRPKNSFISSSSFLSQYPFKPPRTQLLNSDFYPTMATITQESDGVDSPDSFASTTITRTGGKYEGYNETTQSSSYLRTNDGSKVGSSTKNGLPKVVSPQQTDSSMEMFQQRFLDLQERQMELFNDMLNRHEQFLLRLLAQQRVAAEEAQQRDRDFMFKLIEVFLKQK